MCLSRGSLVGRGCSGSQRSPHHNQALDQGPCLASRKAECWVAASRATRMEAGTRYRRPPPPPEAGVLSAGERCWGKGVA